MLTFGISIGSDLKVFSILKLKIRCKNEKNEFLLYFLRQSDVIIQAVCYKGPNYKQTVITCHNKIFLNTIFKNYCAQKFFWRFAFENILTNYFKTLHRS